MIPVPGFQLKISISHHIASIVHHSTCTTSHQSIKVDCKVHELHIVRHIELLISSLLYSKLN